jgi:hypothetical protein
MGKNLERVYRDLFQRYIEVFDLRDWEKPRRTITIADNLTEIRTGALLRYNRWVIMISWECFRFAVSSPSQEFPTRTEKVLHCLFFVAKGSSPFIIDLNYCALKQLILRRGLLLAGLQNLMSHMHECATVPRHTGKKENT